MNARPADSGVPDLAAWRERVLAAEAMLNRTVIGLRRPVRLLVIAILARGHVLLEGGVGVGKTTLLRAAARALGGRYQRVEGTVDLMPQDLVYHTYIDESGKPRVEPGPLLAGAGELSVFFFNEINRARPQVHALLLRVMAERSVTAFNREFRFPHLQVFADRNRVEKEETFELPGASRDRFLMEIGIEPEEDQAIHEALAFDERFHDTDQLIQAIEPGALDHLAVGRMAGAIQAAVGAGPAIRGFVWRLRSATHRPQDFGIRIEDLDSSELVSAGIGPRGASMLVRAAKVAAWLDGAAELAPEHIATVFHEVVAHRIFLAPVHELQREWLAPALTAAIVASVPVL